MPTLEVAGASLYYDIFGSGPILVLIPGATGSGDGFSGVARFLAPHFTVVCLTRRGFSRSIFKGPQDLGNRLSIDADDAACLIKHISPQKSAMVYGNSSGAIVAQALLARHPDCVRKVVVHEPPCISVLPDQQRNDGAGFLQHVYETYRAKGTAPALEIFTEAAQLGEGEAGPMMFAMDSSRGDEIRANVMFWLEFEIRQYTSSVVDLKALRLHKAKYIPAAGIASGDGFGVGPIATIALELGKGLVRLPGGHVGYMTEPEQFAVALRMLLEG